MNKEKKLKTIAIIGVGSIGNFTAKALAKENYNLILIDRDIVEEHNLKNQLLYSKKDLGKPKAIVAKEKLNKNNNITAPATDLTFQNINKLLKKADLILDCTDNLETRFLINDYCLKNNKPWVYSAGLREHGTLMNIIPPGVCFRCVFKPVQGLESCETAGIEINILKKISSLQLMYAKDIFSGETRQVMLRFDNMGCFDKIKVKKNPKCLACKGDYEFLEGKIQTKAEKLCGTNTFQIRGNFKLDEDFKILKNNTITLFKDGRALVKAKNEVEARSLYSKFVGN